MQTRNLIKQFLLLLLLLSGIAGTIVVYFYFSEVGKEKTIREANEALHIGLGKLAISQDLGAAVTDLMVLARHSGFGKMGRPPDPRALNRVARDFLVFSRQKHFYDQIRFLNETGMEVIRIDFNGGRPRIVPKDRLQDKSRRYYFKDTLRLEKGEVFVSPLDLNVEQGKVERPIKPMLRLGTTVFDHQGRKTGIVLLNYFGSRLIRKFEAAVGNIMDHAMILNVNGFWLRNPRPELEWGFMLGHDHTFAKYFSGAWERISKAEAGQFYDHDGLFTFDTVYPLLEWQKSGAGEWSYAAVKGKGKGKGKEYYWKVVARVPNEALAAAARGIVGKLLLIFGPLFGLLVAGSWWLAVARVRHSEAEEALKDSERRKGAIAAELEVSNKELEAFAYSIAHDLRTPLRGIDGFSMALLEDYKDKLDDTGKDHLRRVRAAGRRMGELIDDLLMLSRVGRAGMRRETVDLSAQAHEITARLKEEGSPERRAEFSLQEGLTAYGDAHLLRIVLDNLLDNAYKFTGKEPSARIEFGVTEKDGQGVYYVRDNGVGFDMNYAGKLFGAFQRLHKVEEFSGTGIGLATVARIIHRHGGRVWAEGEVDKGATFFFTVGDKDVAQ